MLNLQVHSLVKVLLLEGLELLLYHYIYQQEVGNSKKMYAYSNRYSMYSLAE